MAEDKKGGSKKSKSEKWKFYKVEGDQVLRTKKSCPRCGPGVYLAEHKNRMTCGKCNYTEFKAKNQ
ncbi:MAG: 30S ribosomal protein S27ae [archaeon]